MPKEPLYPHVPKSRQLLFPHVVKGRQPTVEIKKMAPPETRYGDHAAESYAPARYGIFILDKQVGSILGEARTYMSGPKPWTVYEFEDDIIREVKKFYPPDAFKKAKEFAMNYFEKKGTLLAYTVPAGTCYPDAWRFVIKEGEGYLVHGTVWSRGKRIGHAWVETATGYIWEPETKKFYTEAGFESVAAPVAQQRYTAEEAAIMAARTKHHGPWSEQERRQYLVVRMSPMTAEEGEPVAPQYRHLVGLVSEPLPKDAD